jgi:hypothetical protein
MLTKIGVAALLGTIGTAAVGGGTAMADECRHPVAPVAVTVAAPPIVTPVDYGYGYVRTPGVYYRRDWRERERIRREEAFRHAEWLRLHRFDRR